MFWEGKKRGRDIKEEGRGRKTREVHTHLNEAELDRLEARRRKQYVAKLKKLKLKGEEATSECEGE